MSCCLEESDFEGDVEDFEGDGDFNEWLAMAEDVVEKELLTVPPKSQGAKQGANLVPNMSGDSNYSDIAVDSDYSDIAGAVDSTYNDIAEAVDSGYSDIAGAIQSSDSRSFLSGELVQKVSKEKKSSDATLKRKADSTSERDGADAKTKKTDSDILQVIGNAGNISDTSVSVEDMDENKGSLVLSQEQLRYLDSCLVDEMMNGIKKQMSLRVAKGDRYIVTFSPVELFDLAQSSLQQLIESHPTLAFFFMRQGKFKKKKGYGQVYFSMTSEVQNFIRKLLHVNLSEKRTEVSISAIKSDDVEHTTNLSFVISSSEKSKLLHLLNSGKDPHQPVPVSSKVSFQVEKVPKDATGSLLTILFPLASTITHGKAQEEQLDAGLKGPVNVFYLNQRWIDAVLACCSDFKYNNLSLTIAPPSEKKQAEPALKHGEVHSTTDVPIVEERVSSSEAHSSSRSRHGSGESKSSKYDDADDDISNMTLDVCAGMMESLDKLKQLGTDNPNVLKILEMQSKLTQLQNSLTKKTKRAEEKNSSDSRTSLASRIESETNREDTKGKSVDTNCLQQPKKELESAGGEREKMAPEMDETRLIEEHIVAREESLRRSIESGKQRLREIERQKSQSIKRNPEEFRGKAEHCRRSSSREEENAEMRWPLGGMEPNQGVKLEEPTSDYQSQQGRSAHPAARGIKDVSAMSLSRKRSVEEESSSSVSFEGAIRPTTSFLDSFSGQSGVLAASTQGYQHQGRLATPDQVASVTGLHSKPGIPGQFTNEPDKGLHLRLEEFQQELAQKGIVSSVKRSKPQENQRCVVSPDRPMHGGAPVYTEKEYMLRCKMAGKGSLPPDFYIQTTFLPNRRCPVQDCPAFKVFRTETMFLDHWDMFHKSMVTRRFCHKCTAHFIHADELQAHLVKSHGINERLLASKKVAEARVKVVSNPSYRDPGRFLPPPS